MKKSIVVTSWIIVMSLILPCIVFAGSVILTWKAGPEPDIAGYWAYYGTSERVYGPPIPMGNVTNYTIIGLEEGKTYYFSATAVDTSGNESGYSAECTATIIDTIAPTIAITSPTTAGTYDTADALISISGNVSDNVDVSLVTWANLAGGSGTATGTETWSISDISLSEGENIVTVTAADTAGNQNSTSLAVNYTASQPTPIISNLTVASDTTYEVVDGLDNGSKAYVDSDFTYSNLPNILKNATYIRTSINDSTGTTKAFIRFTVNKDVTVCLAHDDRIPKPLWLPIKNKTKADLAIGNEVMSIYARFFRAGRKVKLGGNEGDINSNMYTVIIVER